MEQKSLSRPTLKKEKKMVHNKKVLYKVQGDRLRKIRESLDLTKTKVSEESGINCKSIYNYENGLTFPCLIYLRYLNDKHRVNLNYIFGGEERKFMLGTSGNPPDFGNLQELVYKMLKFMDGNTYECLRILAYSTRLSECVEW